MLVFLSLVAVSYTHLDNGSAFEVADRSAIPEDVYLSGEGRDYLIALISQLAPKYRIIVVLREICGCLLYTSRCV